MVVPFFYSAYFDVVILCCLPWCCKLKMLLTLMITILCFDFHVISSNDEYDIMLTLVLKISINIMLTLMLKISVNIMLTLMLKISVNIMLTLMLKIYVILTQKWMSCLDIISIDEYVVSSLDSVNHDVYDDNKSKLSIWCLNSKVLNSRVSFLNYGI